MSPAASFTLCVVLAYAGMLGLCLGMDRHWKQLAIGRLPAYVQRLCRPIGVLSLGLAGWAAGLVWPVGMAIVAWFGSISLAGFALLMLMPYAPRLALWLPVASGMLLAVAVSL
ncbi:DUF3325 domain-containing protein [Stutzerimonas urumqiensis]|uniref:DUF3325 domain-containing protein n=1 Tax=Stutzerimonas urumqiensis TaxID=638269 RepID=UPI003BAA1DD5